MYLYVKRRIDDKLLLQFNITTERYTAVLIFTRINQPVAYIKNGNNIYNIF